MFGGSEGSHYFNDLYLYDAELDSWEIIVAEGGPSGRTNHATDVDKHGNLVVFGGFTDSGFDNAVYMFNTTARAWSGPIDTYGDAPTPRELATLTIYKDLGILFGGFH
jgi:N-acetylneuraminic acid mutarotase